MIYFQVDVLVSSKTGNLSYQESYLEVENNFLQFKVCFNRE